MLKRMIAISQLTLRNTSLLFIAMAALTLGAPVAQACMTGSQATSVYNQAITAANLRFADAQNHAIAQLNVDHAAAKAAYDHAISQQGDDHSSDHYNQAITDFNHANAEAEATYKATVSMAQAHCQTDFEMALKQYHTNTCS